MHDFTRGSVLAADLDGTLVPLDGSPQNVDDLSLLKTLLHEHQIPLLFVTGRHFESALAAIEHDGVPTPEFIISALGTLMHQRTADGTFAPVDAYRDHLDGVISNRSVQSLRHRLDDIDGLALQGEHCQGPFKLSYFANYDQLESLGNQIESRLGDDASRFSVTRSFDPNSKTAYLDVLPRGMSKAYALRWWSDFVACPRDNIVFAGDSGNDREVFCDGYRTVMVANTDPSLARDIFETHRREDWQNRLRLTQTPGPSGVLEGCRWFELIPHDGAKLPTALGATPISYQRTFFRVWAAKHEQVSVEFRESGRVRRKKLQRDYGGYFIGDVAGAGPGTPYRYRLNRQMSRPDPTSRRQPDDVHGDSQVITGDNFPWQDQTWTGINKRDLVIYELHIGSFTEEGTFRAAIDRIPHLLELGVTAIELLPVAQSPGKWNWGYDGVGLFAVQHHYGTPDDLRALVDACHRVGLAVLLDVVYNHLGPEGNYLNDFAPYFSKKHGTPWGQALDYDSRRAQPVRDFVVSNVLYWLDEYHLDGLRLDAVHFLFDDRDETILTEIRSAVTEYAAGVRRTIHLIAEANIYDDELLDGGSGSERAYDAIWCDDIMQSIYAVMVPDVRLTPRTYCGPDDLAEALAHGYLYRAPQAIRATDADRATRHQVGDATYLHSLVVALQTHDAVGNHPHGKRFHQLTSPDAQKAAAALVLLYPAIPLLFMGEENATTGRFPFFVDFHDHNLRRAVDRGRAREYPQHAREGAPSPSDPRAFHSSKCQQAGSDDESMFGWYRALLSLRKDWMQAGWLAAHRITACSDPDLGWFAFHYQIDKEDSLFVLSRLAMSPAVDSMLDLQPAKEIYLDSRGLQSTTTRAVDAPCAIIGRGSYTLRQP